MSDSPRTDAQQEAEDRFDGSVAADFARTLERELARCDNLLLEAVEELRRSGLYPLLIERIRRELEGQGK